jgi:hypothetical protein
MLEAAEEEEDDDDVTRGLDRQSIHPSSSPSISMMSELPLLVVPVPVPVAEADLARSLAFMKHGRFATATSVLSPSSLALLAAIVSDLFFYIPTADNY